MGGDEDVLLPVGLDDGHQAVALVEAQGAETVLTDVAEGGHRHALHRTVSRHHGQTHGVDLVLVGIALTEVEHGLYPLVRLDLQDVDQGDTTGGTTALGDLIALLAVDLARIGEEEDTVVGRGGEHVADIVLVAGGDALLTLSALALSGIFADRGALNVAVLGEGKDALLLFNEILDVQIVLHILNLRLALVAVFVADLGELVLQHAAKHCLAAEELHIVGDALFQLIVLVLQLLAVETLQGDEAHIADGLCLHLGEVETLHQVILGVIVAGADDLDDFVNIILRDQEALQQVLTLAGLLQIILSAAGDDLQLEGQIFINNVPQRQDLGLLLIIHQRQHIDGEAGLHLGLGKEAIQDHLRIGITLEVNDDAHTAAVGLIGDVADALKALIVHLICHVLNEHALIDLIGQLGDDNTGAALHLLKLRAGAEDHLAAACGVGGADAAAAHDDAAGGEVGARHVLHQIIEGGLGVIQHADTGVDDLGEVMRGNVGSHTHGDTAGTVHQQVGEAGGQHAGLFTGLVEVGVPIHRVLFDVAEHFASHLGHASLRVSVGGRGVAVHSTEVTVTVNELIAHGEALCQTHQSIVHAGVTMGMVTTQHITDGGNALTVGLIVGEAVLVHGVENAAVDGLQAIADIGQGTTHDDGHSVLDVGGLHLLYKLALHDFLLGIAQRFGIVVHIFMCHCLR